MNQMKKGLLTYSVLIYIISVILFDSSKAYINYVNLLLVMVFFFAFTSKIYLHSLFRDDDFKNLMFLLFIPALLSLITYFFYTHETTVFRYLGNLSLVVLLTPILKALKNPNLIPISFIVGSLLILFIGHEQFLLILATGRGRADLENFDGMGSVMNPNVIAIVFSISSLFLFDFFLRSKNSFQKILFLMSSLLLMYIVLQTTGSKKGLVLVVINTLWMIVKLFGQLKKNKFSILPIIGFFYGGWYYFSKVFKETTTFSRFQDFANSSSGVGSSDAHRTNLIAEGLNMWYNRPILGNGLGSFSSLTTSEFSYSHSNYVEILLSVGIVGFFSYYAVYWKLLTGFRKNRNSTLDIGLSVLIIVQILLLDFAAVTFSLKVTFILLAYLIANLKMVQKPIYAENYMCHR